MQDLLRLALFLCLFGGQARGQDKPASDVAEVPSVDLQAPADEAMRYFLIGGSGLDQPREKQNKQDRPRKLLLVLPGGSGSADFHPFVQRIWKNVLSEEWLVAQLVAPQWSEDQAKSLVWPTKKSPWPKMRFTTGEFIDAVIDDVERRYPVDPNKLFSLSWSSSGSAAYTASLAKNTRITGSFVAMSVFKPDSLPSLKTAKGKAYYLLHSPEDFIPIRMAQDAEKKLTKAKAKVHLETYAGGHGWRGNVFGMMRTGIAWLEENHSKGPKRKRRK